MTDAFKRQSGAPSPGGTWRRRLLAVMLIALLCLPPTVIARAQDAAPVDDGTATEIVLPEPDEPDPAPVTEEPVLADPATPDALESDVVATAVPANSDTIELAQAPGETPFAPGESRELHLTYAVTTPRLATTIVAQIGDAASTTAGWTLQLGIADQWSEPGVLTSSTDAENVTEATAIPITLIVTAPVEIVADETVTIWISSSALRADGIEETGLTSMEPFVYATVALPVVAPTDPTAEPILDPTAEPVIEPTIEPEPTPNAAPIFTPFMCAANQPAAVPGGSIVIACTLPDDAWALRGGSPTYSYLTSGELASAAGIPLADQRISIPLTLPCALSSSELWVSVDVALAEGIALQAVVTLPVDTSAIDSTPIVSYSDVAFGTAIWDGSAWSPVTATVTVTVDAGSSACSPNAWSIQATVSPLLGATEIDSSLSYTGGWSSSDAIVAAPAGGLVLGAPLTVGSGTGSGTLTLELTLSLPPDAPAGSYHGAMSFEIATGP